ncbi:MAG TPA: hypothetical protein VFY28_00230, partial [Candidatus Paceibacterota bacterium]|nr:hypothetical protein [Candidatus Paceibacterota bacterium]
MLRDRRLWLSLLAAAIVAVVYLYLRFERPLPAISGVNWYLLPFFVSIGLVVPVFGKDWESPLAMAFVTFAVGSVLIVTVATWLLQHAVMNPQLLAVIIQDFTDARAMSNE